MPEPANAPGKILGLIGRNVDYSCSPFIHNTAAAMLRLPLYYTVFNIESPELIPAALDGARALGIAGFNVTIPYKRTVVACMDDLSSEARATGAVNTIVNRNGRLSGYNTDIEGVSGPLGPYAGSLCGKPAGIFGNGGAALAAVEALRRSVRPSAINLFVRDRKKGLQLETALEHSETGIPLVIRPADDYAALRQCSLVLNATPVGTKGFALGFDNCIVPSGTGAIHKGQVVFDMVYNPVQTPLLEMAREAGAATIPGIDMLLAQAAKSFSIWTGETMPTDEIRPRVLAVLESGNRKS